MLLSDDVLDIIRKLQKENGNLLLCGSAALILHELLPNRHMSDIDFAINEKFLINTKMNIYPDSYNELNKLRDNYASYSCREHIIKVNLLVFNDDIKLNTEESNNKIKCQALTDIINWKEKYNRPKDIKDLEKILTKVIENTILHEEKS